MFGKFKETGDAIVAVLDPNDSVTLVAGLQTIVSTWAVIYILYIAYMFHLGKVDNPVRQIVYKMMMFGFISLFAFNAGEWYDFAIKGVKGLSDWLSHGGLDVIYTKLEDGIITINKISNVYFDVDDWAWLKLMALVGTAIIFICYVVLGVTLATLLVINVVTLQIVIILTPFAFASLFFPKINAIFDRWLEMIISNIFTIYFLSLFANVILDKYVTILTDELADAGKVDILLSAFSISAFSLLGIVLLYMSTQVASKLSSVSIESIPKGAMIATAITGVGAGKAYSGGKSAGKQIGNAGKAVASKSISAVSGISRSAGDYGSKAHGLLKETGRKATAERRAGGKKS